METFGSSVCLLALDQGTSSSRAFLFDSQFSRPPIMARRTFRQIYPEGKSGWVEHDPEAIWRSVMESAREALDAHEGPLAALGLTNQRETTILWDRKSGAPLYNAIVWQDRRTEDACARLRKEGAEKMIAARTGLRLDPYFSATKIGWLLDNVEGAREKAARGDLAFGTVDSFLLWRLTGGRVHATDATNASRTMLYDIHKGCWDDDLLRLFDVPLSLLPDVLDCAADFGRAEAFGGAPIRGVAGDQQAAAIGQCCFAPGMAKATYGTGCFLLLNTEKPPVSREGILTTLSRQIGGQRAYALEGSVFIAGAVVQWLRDSLGLIESAAETEDLARQGHEDKGVYMVPAFAGLGAPYWDSDARGAIVGLTQAAGKADLVRAALESVVYQSCDLIEALGDARPKILRVDGGMTVNNWLMQFLADMTGLVVERPEEIETTARGAAVLAALGAGLYDSLEDAARDWRTGRRFTPAMKAAERARRLAGWKEAVARIRSGS